MYQAIQRGNYGSGRTFDRNYSRDGVVRLHLTMVLHRSGQTERTGTRIPIAD
jgi:hypothetical protein